MTRTRNLGDTLMREDVVRVNQINPARVLTEAEQLRKIEDGLASDWYKNVPNVCAPSDRLVWPEKLRRRWYTGWTTKAVPSAVKSSTSHNTRSSAAFYRMTNPAFPCKTGGSPSLVLIWHGAFGNLRNAHQNESPSSGHHLPVFALHCGERCGRGLVRKGSPTLSGGSLHPLPRR